MFNDEVDQKAARARAKHNAELEKAATRAWKKKEQERLRTEQVQKENGSWIPPLIDEEKQKLSIR